MSNITPADRAKALVASIDMEYVILGTHNELGIDSNPLWAEVQAANMRKTGGATREDGKIMKPEGWRPPDVTGALRAQGWQDGDADTDIEMSSDELAERFAAVCKEVNELTPTERGDKGFGSTGR